MKLSIYENDYNNNKQQWAIDMLEKMIVSKEISDPEQLSTCYLKLSKWNFDIKDQMKMQVEGPHEEGSPTLLAKATIPQITGEDFEKVIGYCKKATEVVKSNNEAWHFYSQINYEASKFYC